MIIKKTPIQVVWIVLQSVSVLAAVALFFYLIYAMQAHWGKI